jgi:hypothetical protein
VLAFCYRNGTGVRVDQEQAHRWAQLAAQKGRCVDSRLAIVLSFFTFSCISFPTRRLGGTNVFTLTFLVHVALHLPFLICHLEFFVYVCMRCFLCSLESLMCSIIAAHELGVHLELGVGCDVSRAASHMWYQCAAKASCCRRYYQSSHVGGAFSPL